MRIIGATTLILIVTTLQIGCESKAQKLESERVSAQIAKESKDHVDAENAAKAKESENKKAVDKIEKNSKALEEIHKMILDASTAAHENFKEALARTDNLEERRNARINAIKNRGENVSKAEQHAWLIYKNWEHNKNRDAQTRTSRLLEVQRYSRSTGTQYGASIIHIEGWDSVDVSKLDEETRSTIIWLKECDREEPE